MFDCHYLHLSTYCIHDKYGLHVTTIQEIFEPGLIYNLSNIEDRLQTASQTKMGLHKGKGQNHVIGFTLVSWN
jgi:hypothetical protein